MSDDVVDLKLLGKRVADIQQTLREIRTIADVDRRNNRALYDSLAFEMARHIGAVDSKVEALAERVEELSDRIEERFNRIEQLLRP